MAETKEKKEPTVQERLFESGIKAVEKKIKDRTSEQLDAGQKPADILGALLQSLQVPKERGTIKQQVGKIQQENIVDVPGSQIGLLGTLMKAVTGKGIKSPFSPRQAPIEFGEALDILQERRKQAGEQRKVPEAQLKLLKGIADLAKQTGNRELLGAVTELLGGQQQLKQRGAPGPLGAGQAITIKGQEELPFLERDPLTGDLTLESKRIQEKILVGTRASETAKSQRVSKQLEIKTNFDTSVSLFKNLVSQLRGGIEEGGAGGLLQGLYGDINVAFKNEKFSRTAAIQGQIKETALTLNRILTGQNRVIKGVLEMILTTLPTNKDPEKFIGNKIEQSVRNAFGITKAFEKAGLSSDVLDKMSQKELDSLDVRKMLRTMSLTPQDQAEIDQIVNDVLAAPATKPRGFTKPEIADFSKLSDEELRAIEQGE